MARFLSLRVRAEDARGGVAWTGGVRRIRIRAEYAARFVCASARQRLVLLPVVHLPVGVAIGVNRKRGLHAGLEGGKQVLVVVLVDDRGAALLLGGVQVEAGEPAGGVKRQEHVLDGVVRRQGA